ncbi:hypothetical protein J1614_002854 [Plenodomus biglobosus]|nr:hypothetical protein J1614_002854 [Plenodomus biglobosus]
MADQWSKAPVTQLPRAMACVSAVATDDECVQPPHPSRPTLKRRRKYSLQTSFSNTFKRQRTSSDRSSSADYPRSSPPFHNIEHSDPSSKSNSSSSSKIASTSERILTQHGTSRKTSLIAQFLQQFTRPLKCMPGSKHKETPVIIPFHLREGAIAADSYPTSVEYSDHDLQLQLFNNLAHVGMASIPDINLYFNASPAAGPSNYYARPDFRNFRARGRAPATFSRQDMRGNPLAPTRDTNRDASVDSQRWSELRPGTPGMAHEFSYFPPPRSRKDPLQPTNTLVPRAQEILPNLSRHPSDYRPGTADRRCDSTQTQGRFTCSDLSEQLSVLDLPLSMPTAHRNRTTSLPSCLKKSAHHSGLSSTTPSVANASHRTPSGRESSSSLRSEGKYTQRDMDNDADDNTNVSSVGDVPRSQPIDIPQTPHRDIHRPSLHRIQSSEHLRVLSVSLPDSDPMDVESSESTPPRRVVGGPRLRVSSTIRFVEPDDQEEGDL